MNWRDHRVLAAQLRNQGLADVLAASKFMISDTFLVDGKSTDFGHVIVMKCQQAAEKLLKGYLLWHVNQFDPSQGHTPVSRALETRGKEFDIIYFLCIRLNKINGQVVNELKWLERLAPRAPIAADGDQGNQQPLNIIQENSEYPFWCEADGALCTPAVKLSARIYGVRAMKAVRNLCTALENSNPVEFTKTIAQFMRQYPTSTTIQENYAS